MLRYLTATVLLLLAARLLTIAARFIMAAHRLTAGAKQTAPLAIDVPHNDVAHALHAPDRFDVTMTINEIMNRTVH